MGTEGKEPGVECPSKLHRNVCTARHCAQIGKQQQTEVLVTLQINSLLGAALVVCVCQTRGVVSSHASVRSEVSSRVKGAGLQGARSLWDSNNVPICGSTLHSYGVHAGDIAVRSAHSSQRVIEQRRGGERERESKALKPQGHSSKQRRKSAATWWSRE